MQASRNLQLNGVTTLIRKIIIGTAFFEGAGTLILAIRFCPKMGFGTGLWNALFHSVSAFCNAGFDLMGKYEKFSSFTTLRSDVVVQLTLMALIVIGGIGFFVWSDLIKCKMACEALCTAYENRSYNDGFSDFCRLARFLFSRTERRARRTS